jgi:hypothetical protein
MSLGGGTAFPVMIDGKRHGRPHRHHSPSIRRRRRRGNRRGVDPENGCARRIVPENAIAPVFSNHHTRILPMYDDYRMMISMFGHQP